MKKLSLLTLVTCFYVFTAGAQLGGTKWSGTANLLMPDKSLATAEITWNFGKDTVYVLFAGGGEPEVLTYQVQKNIITVTKISGESPCEVGTTGKLSFEIKDDKLFLAVVESKCEAFTKALDNRPYIKMK